MDQNFNKRINKNDEFLVTRHSTAEYKLDRGITGSENPETTPKSSDQWFYSDLTSEGKQLAKEKSIELLDKLSPETDALFFVSSDLVRAAETAKIYLDTARDKGFEIIQPRSYQGNNNSYKNKAEEIGEGDIRKLNCLTLDHLENMLREEIFLSTDSFEKILPTAKISEDTKKKWAAARKIIESDNKGTWGDNYYAHSEEIAKIFPDVKSAKEVYETKFKEMLHLIRFAQEKIANQNPEKNIKILAFTHENSFIYFLNENFGSSFKNCETISFKLEQDKDDKKQKIIVSTKGQIKKINI
jgi:phosphohistidine phosphatase SixA